MTAIVVNWNGAALLPACLDSLLDQSHADLRIVVVDNGSVDDSERVVKARAVDWIGLPSNIGLAGAYNEGAREATSDLLLFLNNDMRFPSDFVERMMACLERNENCWAVDAVQRDWDDREVVHQGTALVKGPLRGRLPGWRFESVPTAADGKTVWPSGANTLIRRDVFERLGGWDNRFFAGYEDVDLGWRIWLAGGEVRIATDAVCWHKVGSSSEGEGKPVRDAAAVHGPLLFALKHAPPSIAIAAIARSVLSLPGYAVRLNADRLRRHFDALTGAMVEMPRAIRERRRIYRSGVATPRKLWATFGSLFSTAAPHGRAPGRCLS